MPVDLADLYSQGSSGSSASPLVSALLPNPYQSLLRRQGLLAGAGQNLMQSAASAPVGGTGGMIAKALLGLGGGVLQGLAYRNISDADKQIQEGLQQAYQSPDIVKALMGSSNPTLQYSGQTIALQNRIAQEEQAAKAANAMALIGARGEEDRKTELFKNGLSGQTPTVKQITIGDQQVEAQWNPETKTWDTIGTPGPRFAPQAPNVQEVPVGKNAAGEDMIQKRQYNPATGAFDIPIGQPMQRSVRDKPEMIGDLTPKELETVRQVQKDYNDDVSTKAFKQTRGLVEAAHNATDDITGDRVLIKAVEKLLDPNSAVLAGEQQGYGWSVASLGGLWNTAKGMADTGTRIPEPMRQSMIQAIDGLNSDVQQVHDQTFKTNVDYLGSIDPKLANHLRQVQFEPGPRASQSAAAAAGAPAAAKPNVTWSFDEIGNLRRK